MNKKGFTLIELLVAISIIGILAAVSLFALQGARQSARDTRRKSDIEAIRSAIELYRADCNDYPAALTPGQPLIGDNTPSSCSSTNTYMAVIPDDPVTGRDYGYSTNAGRTTYALCSSLESAGTTVSGCATCGSGTCNYKTVSP